MHTGLYAYIILSLIILILLLTIVRLQKRYKKMVFAYEYRINQFRQSHKDINKQNSELKKMLSTSSLSIINLTNALRFKPSADSIRHIDICEIKGGQKIVVIIDEEFRYMREYYDQRVGDVGKGETFIDRRDIECMAFIDGQLIDPIIVDPIPNGDTISVLKDIHCGKFIGRGMGSVVLESLFKVLRGIGIKTLKAGLSIRDYPVKDKLYKFYLTYNGFILVKELTEDHWGRVEKNLTN